MKSVEKMMQQRIDAQLEASMFGSAATITKLDPGEGLTIEKLEKTFRDLQLYDLDPVLLPTLPSSPLQRLIAEFKFGEPLKSLFNPRFTVHKDGEMVMVTLWMTAPDAYEQNGKVDIQLGRILDERYERTTVEHILQFLRGMVQDMLTHEMDESIVFEGRRCFDPHDSEARASRHQRYGHTVT